MKKTSEYVECMQNFASKMRKTRKQKGMSIKELAQKAGYSCKSSTQWNAKRLLSYERGDLHPSFGVMCSISGALGCSIVEMINGEKDEIN